MGFYFAWVDATDTTFGVQHHVEDEDVFGFELAHEEGQMPTLQIVLRNPRVGLLNASRKQWVWLSYNDGTTTTALFFGRLVGIPSNIFEELVTLTFVSRSNDHIALKQSLADSLAVRPYWEPLFLDDKSRRDPDAIIEGRAAAYHVDRLSLAWTISDILTGEDGTVTFSEDEVIYDSVSVDILETPIKEIRCDASVQWTQVFQPNPIFVGSWVVNTYTGGSLISEWPKPGTSLGGGWMAAQGTMAVDVNNVEHATNHTESGSWSDRNHRHQQGDAISGSYSASLPMAAGMIINRKNTADFGYIGDTGGDTGKGFGSGIVSGAPQGSNIDDTSCSVSSTWTVIPLWKVSTSLWITYDPTENPFGETLSLTVAADLQDVLADADTQQETEVIEFNGPDVGEPLLDYRVRSSIDSTAVAVGQIILPNEPTGPGGTSFQICVQAGTTAGTPPQFSDTVGATTTDGTAIFACIGGSLPSVGSWSGSTYYRVGALICDSRPGGSIQLCTTNGYTGDSLPTSFGATTADGTVVWTSLGAGGPSISIPVGGTPGAITAIGFFPQDRGLWAIEYMIQRARARILTRARCIEVGWSSTFSKGLNLSCRKNATIADHRLPGGVATGKIISYRLIVDGETGDFRTDVRIGCAVGNAGSVAAEAGEPTYAESDYVGSDYQVYTGVVTSFGDVGYTPPAPDPNYSGYSYPLTAEQVVMAAAWNGASAQQAMAISRMYATAVREATRAGSYTQFSQQATGGALTGQDSMLSTLRALAEAVNSVYFTLQLRPIAGALNLTPYTVSTTGLCVPKQIDLEADSVS